MKAVIMAAGIGDRLRPLTDRIPKCLIEINGRTLLDRHIETLKGSGVREICAVVGHKKEMIISRFGEMHKGVKIVYTENGDFKSTGSGYSLWLGLSRESGEVLFMDADIAYEKEAIEPILSSKRSDLILVGNDRAVDDEGVKVLADGDTVKEIGKAAKKDLPCVGESVGIVRLSDKSRTALLEQMDSRVERGDKNFEWEEVLNGTLGELALSYVTTGKHKWVEIDFQKDIETAKKILKD